MHKYLGVLSSDALNRDNYLLTIKVLEQGIKDNALRGMPSLIEHDFHRPLGWIFPFGMLIEPKISKTIGNFLVCETDEDAKLIYPKIEEYWHYINHESCKNHLDSFKERLDENYSKDGHFIDKGCVSYNLPNIVEKIFPKLFEQIDKSGLLFLDDILEQFDYIGSGVFKSKSNDFSIFCHQYFNRNLSLINNFNTYFIDEFIRLNSEKNVTLRIAIDRNLIGLSKTFRGTLEFDYWWGPKFNNDISNLPNQVTRYQSNESQKLFSEVIGTEFWWKADGDEKILEIEEIREKPSLGINKETYGCRYIHSIYNNMEQEFVHFDGAIRAYDEEQILKRWDLSINKAGKTTDYTKLFRIDGKLELADWKKLCILFYKSNPLIFEYFGAQDEYNNLVNSTKKASNQTNYIPNKINTQDGIRLFVSYFNKSGNYNSFERKVINPDILKFDNGETINVIEYDIIEIEKYLRRNGGELEYPKDIEFVKPFDNYTNYPIIVHGSKNVNILLKNTLKAFQTIFEIQNQTLNKTISLTLGWEMEDFEVRLSVFGKSSEISKWLIENQNIPTEYELFKKWVFEQRKWIYNNYEYNEKEFTHLLKDDGIFYIKRKTIDHNIISFSDEEDITSYKIHTEGKEELNQLIENSVIYPSYLGLLKKITCSKTGENYLTSNTSKYLDKGVHMVIEKIRLIAFFWTDEEYF